jgi:hypothetical protein
MRRGTRSTAYVDEDLWVYVETTVDTKGVTDTVYVAVNRNDTDLTTNVIPPGLPELVIGGSTSTGNDTIPARETRIFSSYVATAGEAGVDGG